MKKDEPREYLQKRHYPCNLLKGKDPSLTANLVLIKRIFRPVFANYVGKLIFYFFFYFFATYVGGQYHKMIVRILLKFILD